MSVTPETAKQVALGSVIGAGVIGSVQHISQGQWPPLTTFVGVFVASAALLTIADFAPSLALGFGLLVLVGSLLRDGVPAARKLTTALGG